MGANWRGGEKRCSKRRSVSVDAYGKRFSRKKAQRTQKGKRRFWKEEGEGSAASLWPPSKRGERDDQGEPGRLQLGWAFAFLWHAAVQRHLRGVPFFLPDLPKRRTFGSSRATALGCGPAGVTAGQGG